MFAPNSLEMYNDIIQDTLHTRTHARTHTRTHTHTHTHTHKENIKFVIKKSQTKAAFSEKVEQLDKTQSKHCNILM